MVRVTVTDDNEEPTVTGKDSVNYVENGKDPVATFTATDPEGATSITWSMATDPYIKWPRKESTRGCLTTPTPETSMIDDDDGELKFNIRRSMGKRYPARLRESARRGRQQRFQHL